MYTSLLRIQNLQWIQMLSVILEIATCLSKQLIRIHIFREGNDPGDSGQITYTELKDKVCQFANVLKSLGK